MTKHSWVSWKQPFCASLIREQINDHLLNNSQTKGQCPSHRPTKRKTSEDWQENSTPKNSCWDQSLEENSAGTSGPTADQERSWKHEETQPSLNLSLKETDPYTFFVNRRNRLPMWQELLCLKITICEPHGSKNSCKNSTHETCKSWPSRRAREGSNKHRKGKVASCFFSVSCRHRDKRSSNVQ